MSETPTESTEPTEPQPEEATCVHCGAKSETPQLPGADWLCGSCDRYQDSAVCPTCHSVVRASLMEGHN